jgi:hypothetical protein
VKSAHIQVVEGSFAFKGGEAHLSLSAEIDGKTQTLGGLQMSHLFPNSGKLISFAVAAAIVLVASLPLLTLASGIVA